MSDSLVLDSFALLALLRNEPGAERVRDLLIRAQEAGATLVTGDPEFRVLESVLSVEWLST